MRLASGFGAHREDGEKGDGASRPQGQIQAPWAVPVRPESMPAIERFRSGIFGIHDQGIAAHGTFGIEAALHGTAEQQRPKPMASPTLIAGQASHPEAGHRIGRQGASIRHLQIRQRHLGRREGVEAGDRVRVVRWHEHKGLADAAPHGLVSVLLEKAIERCNTAAEALAIVALGVEPLLLKHG